MSLRDKSRSSSTSLMWAAVLSRSLIVAHPLEGHLTTI